MSRSTVYTRFLSAGFPFKAFNRDIWLICLSNVIGAFGEGLYFWVFPIYIRQLQANPVQLGLVFSALLGVSALAVLPGGLLADRFDRKKILILAWTPWVFAPFLYSFAQNWVQLIPGAACWGISMIGVPAVNAYIITSVVDRKNLAFVLSFVWASYSFSYIFAPAVGASLAIAIGMRWVLRLAALFCAAATGVFLLIHSQHPRKDKPAFRSQPSVQMKKLWRRILPWSIFLTATTFFANLARPFVPGFLHEIVGMNEFYIGLFGSISYAGMTLIGVGAGRLSDKGRRSDAIGLCLALYAASMIPLLVTSETTALMLAAFLFSSSLVIGSLVSSYVGTIAPSDRRGLWVSIPATMSLVASVLAPFVGGFLYTQSPYYALAASVIPIPLLALIAVTILKE